MTDYNKEANRLLRTYALRMASPVGGAWIHARAEGCCVPKIFPPTQDGLKAAIEYAAPRTPEDIYQATCPDAGKPGHLTCGWCSDHSQPIIDCYNAGYPCRVG